MRVRDRGARTSAGGRPARPPAPRPRRAAAPWDGVQRSPDRVGVQQALQQLPSPCPGRVEAHRSPSHPPASGSAPGDAPGASVGIGWARASRIRVTAESRDRHALPELTVEHLDATISPDRLRLRAAVRPDALVAEQLRAVAAAVAAAPRQQQDGDKRQEAREQRAPGAGARPMHRGGRDHARDGTTTRRAGGARVPRGLRRGERAGAGVPDAPRSARLVQDCREPILSGKEPCTSCACPILRSSTTTRASP